MHQGQTVGSRRRALVIGGSIAGLATALHLKRIGWDVDVYERTAEPLAGRGAGIITHPELRAALAMLGIETASGFGVELNERMVLGGDNRPVARWRFPQVSASWAAVHKGLAVQLGPIRVHRGAEFVGWDKFAGRFAAHFSDGRRETADLLVGADGIRSRVREIVAGGVTPVYAGYVAWRGMAPETAVARGADAALAQEFLFCLPPNEQMLGYLVPGADDSVRPGERNYNFVWYRPAHGATDLPRLLTDADGKQHAQSVPPDRISPLVIAQMRADADRLLAPWFRHVVAATAKPFLQPLYDVTVPQMHGADATALVGDAAFTIRPHVGGGVLKALDDAAALAAALQRHQDVPAALAAYSAARCPVGHAMVAKARALGSYLKSTYANDVERTEAMRHAAPDAVLRETANLQFLDILKQGQASG